MAKAGLREQLSSLSDDQLRTLILSVSAAAGVPQESARSLTDDIPGLRKKLSYLGDKEIGALLAAIGTSGAEDAIRNLRKRQP